MFVFSFGGERSILHGKKNADKNAGQHAEWRTFYFSICSINLPLKKEPSQSLCVRLPPFSDLILPTENKSDVVVFLVKLP